jgi:hypothetical protein
MQAQTARLEEQTKVLRSMQGDTHASKEAAESLVEMHRDAEPAVVVPVMDKKLSLLFEGLQRLAAKNDIDVSDLKAKWPNNHLGD